MPIRLSSPTRPAQEMCPASSTVPVADPGIAPYAHQTTVLAEFGRASERLSLARPAGVGETRTFSLGIERLAGAPALEP